jgi:hypothetical protein
MNTTTLGRSTASRSAVSPISVSLNKAMTRLLGGLGALDKKLQDRPASTSRQIADLLRLAEAYESTQPSYAADLRAAALTASHGEILSR